MKNTGLKNRFPEAVRFQWQWWYDCLVCGKNQWDALHHIISPSVRHYVDGDHNKSILNSCPIHNQICHIGNESFLHNDEVLETLLARSFWAQEQLGYALKPIDIKFFQTYRELYSERVIKMVESRYSLGDSRKPYEKSTNNNTPMLDEQNEGAVAGEEQAAAPEEGAEDTGTEATEEGAGEEAGAEEAAEEAGEQSEA